MLSKQLGVSSKSNAFLPYPACREPPILLAGRFTSFCRYIKKGRPAIAQTAALLSATLMSMTECERWGLRGPVHSCRLQRTWYLRRCGADACDTEERGDNTVIEFRADGAVARRSHHNPDGSEWTTTYEYNNAGQLTTARSDNGRGLVDLQVYKYDTLTSFCRVP